MSEAGELPVASWRRPRPAPIERPAPENLRERQCKTPDAERCQVIVTPVYPLKFGGGMEPYRCFGKAMIVVDGVRHCAMHHPTKKAEIEAHHLDRARDLLLAAGFAVTVAP